MNPDSQPQTRLPRPIPSLSPSPQSTGSSTAVTDPNELGTDDFANFGAENLLLLLLSSGIKSGYRDSFRPVLKGAAFLFL